MIEKKIQIFDANKSTKEGALNYHCKVVKNGIVKNKGCIMIVDENEVSEITKWELDEFEKESLSMMKNSCDKALDVYDSCKRKLNKLEKTLIKTTFGYEDFYIEDCDCVFSPIGKCVTIDDACIFCNNIKVDK